MQVQFDQQPGNYLNLIELKIPELPLELIYKILLESRQSSSFILLKKWSFNNAVKHYLNSKDESVIKNILTCIHLILKNERILTNWLEIDILNYYSFNIEEEVNKLSRTGVKKNLDLINLLLKNEKNKIKDLEIDDDIFKEVVKKDYINIVKKIKTYENIIIDEKTLTNSLANFQIEIYNILWDYFNK